MSRSSTRAPAEVFYPESDGKPMGETGIHSKSTLNLMGILDFYFKKRADVYVAADMFFYYEQGNPRAVKAPDVMVIQGLASNEERRTYKLWVEKQVPCVVFEFTSKETRREDTVVKRDLYARLGVTEYFLFDPLHEYLDHQLIGYRLEQGRYVPITPDSKGRLESLELGLKFEAWGYWVRVYAGPQEKHVPGFIEIGDVADQQARELLTLENALTIEKKQLESERKKAARHAKKAEAERQKAEAERQKAEAERQKAEAERQKALALEEEVRRLRAMLEGRQTEA